MLLSCFSQRTSSNVGPWMHTNLPVVWKPCGFAVHSVAKRNSCAAVATNACFLLLWSTHDECNGQSNSQY